MAETTEEYRNRINQLKTGIENEPYIKKMREDIAEGISKTGNRQADIEIRQENLESDFAAVQQDARSNTPSGAELAVAAGPYNTLGERLDAEQNKVNAQLAQKASINYVDAILMDIAKGGPNSGPQGPFMSLASFNSYDFPDGRGGTWLVFDSSFDDGAHSFMWDSSNSVWKDLGVYQTTGLGEGTVEIKHLDLVERENITEYSAIEGTSYQDGFMAKWGNLEDLPNYRFKEFNVKPSEKLKITADITATEGALAVFKNAAGEHISFYKPVSETGSVNYTDEMVTVPANATRLYVSSLKSQKEIVVKRLSYVNTNNLKSRIANVENETNIVSYENVTSLAENRSTTYVGVTGQIENLSNYHTYILDVTPNEVLYITAEITATSGRLAVFKNFDSLIGTFGTEKKQYTKEKVVVPPNASKLYISVTNGRTATIEKGTSRKVKTVLESSLNDISSTKYDGQLLTERISDYESMLEFKWKPYDKGYVTIIVDDGLPDLYRFQEKMTAKGFPLTVAIPTHKLNDTQGNGQTTLSLLKEIESSGGEVMSHSVSSEVFTDTTSNEIAEYRLRESRRLLNEQGFEAKGFVKPGGTGSLPTLAKFDHIVRKYYRYGFSAGATEPYYRGRSELHGKTLSTIQSMNASCESEKTWLVWYAHTLNGELDETILDAALSDLSLRNIEVVTPSQMYANFKSLAFK